MRRWLAALLLAGCGAANAQTTTTAEPAASTEGAPVEREEMSASAPTPYTAEQIAAACAPGRWSLYAMVDTSGVTAYSRTSFVGGEPGVATFESVLTDAEGHNAEGEPRVGSAPWEALRDHARYPAVCTTITDETVELPAGTFETRLYTVTCEDGSITRSWFAPALPGPPVRQVTESTDGAVVSSMTLIAYHDPR